MSRPAILLLALSTLFLFASASLGAVTSLSGTEKGFWDDHAVIVARIVEITPGALGPRITVNVRAVVATDFLVPTDALVLEDVPLGPESAMAGIKVAAGDTAVVCITRTKDGWTTPRDRLNFFPTVTAIQPLKSTDDPALGTIAAAIRKVRKASSALDAGEKAVGQRGARREG